ncbi:serine/threonine-protein kinase [Polyangium sp. 6x1]|uniref:serine/threonine-protein kinase n=1 Tax=Polyangium sp. 6x1 TaxID=3042689 RepID=UPI002482A676|nr:serine/threonine-protein kinase [Polyangium sp. 6x1]MDI1445212.1 serine/threonine-protein kinase [Polyangium sp. 6x1]
MRLSRHLGQEGKSQVWVAEHVGLGKDVAVKLMGRALSRNSSPLHRFQREADVAARQIKSPHVAQILEHGLTRTGMPYLVMELLEGEDLGSRITRTGPMSPKDTVRLVSQLAKGLGKAHLLGLVHRNLKPGNVFLTETEGGEFEAKVLDLGLSVRAGISSMGRTTSDATHMISPEFMSPEQIFGQKDVDFRADLWTLAVIAYYALSGRVPFSGQNLEGFGNAIEEGRFEPVTTLVPGLPSTIDSFFTKALQRDPTARFSATKELADEFERALALGVEGEERTSRTSFPFVTRSSSPGSRPLGAGTTTGSMRRPKLNSMKEISDRIPPEVRDAAMNPPEVLPVTVAQEEPRKSFALVILMLALLGIGTIVAGLSLLSGDSPPPGPPRATPTAPRR